MRLCGFFPLVIISMLYYYTHTCECLCVCVSEFFFLVTYLAALSFMHSLTLFVPLLSFGPLKLYCKIVNRISYFKHILHSTCCTMCVCVCAPLCFSKHTAHYVYPHENYRTTWFCQCYCFFDCCFPNQIFKCFTVWMNWDRECTLGWPFLCMYFGSISMPLNL